MFGFSAKRQREHDELIDLGDSTFRENKKPRPLALRTSPNVFLPAVTQSNQLAPRFRPSALTPVESSDDDDNGGDNKPSGNTFRNAASYPQQGPRPSALALETPMDVDTTGKDTPPIINGDELSPWPSNLHGNGNVQPSPIPHGLVNQSLNISGGCTPAVNINQTYGYFSANVHSADMMEPDTTMSTGVQISKNMNVGKSEPAWCRQRLPSPISEDEDINKASPRDAEMAYTTSRPESPPVCESYHDQTNDCIKGQRNDPLSMNIEHPKQTANASPGKKKTSVFMGYRADCDKCRRKVPGHYSHIIRV